ncbi:unnamed protein product [Adineta ricciae]|uniref:Uncharacterized protein n=1 Tax=Adineta ricciae TaxID=249248 RepID=A0A813WXY8_ADIRI|nr:unnamed protein product [Adineta ricciae]
MQLSTYFTQYATSNFTVEGKRSKSVSFYSIHHQKSITKIPLIFNRHTQANHIVQLFSALSQKNDSHNQPPYDVTHERYQCAEILFEPPLAPSKGLHLVIPNSILQCDTQIQNAMLGKIILASGKSQQIIHPHV